MSKSDLPTAIILKKASFTVYAIFPLTNTEIFGIIVLYKTILPKTFALWQKGEKRLTQDEAIRDEVLSSAEDAERTKNADVATGSDPERAYWAFNKLMDVSKYFRAYCYQSVVDLGFSLNEIDVLMSLTSHPEKNTVKGISETVHLSKGMISQAVESLRKKKLVTVDHDEKDRRSVLVTLSSVAIPALERLKEASSAFMQKIVSGIPYEQLQSVYQAVTQFYTNKENMRSPKTQNGDETMIGGTAPAVSEDGKS